jgi:uncharacterized ion transporter superfamily protein YfcC
VRLPHPLTLLVGCTIIAAALTHVLPAGKFDMRDDPASGRKVAVAGSYHRVSAHPLTPFETAVAIPDGIIDAASVIVFVFLVGGAFGVVDKTGALRDGIDSLARRLGELQAEVDARTAARSGAAAPTVLIPTFEYDAMFVV